MVKHADAIKALDAQAQGEAVIRKALGELKMWGMARDFTFTESTQSVSSGQQGRVPHDNQEQHDGLLSGRLRGVHTCRCLCITVAPTAWRTLSPGQVAGRQRRTPLIKEWRDAMTEVGDNQSLVASLKQSSYYNMFKDEVSSWENKLSFLQEGLQLLNQIQRKWVYLEPIFGRGALPSQQQRFRNVDEEFRRIMSSLESTKKV